MSYLTQICGVDEAGRGPWAGPVTAGAVILDPARPVAGLTDSKKLSEARRVTLEAEIKDKALAWAVAEATPAEIDRLNIRKATLLAMRRAVIGLGFVPDEILIDGNVVPSGLPAPARAIVKGDLSEPAISAASILAKTARDALMKQLCVTYPGYGFAGHKGYGTAAHATALRQLGPCEIHRQSFAPVAAAARGLDRGPLRSVPPEDWRTA
jgi:ribonuclease HII